MNADSACSALIVASCEAIARIGRSLLLRTLHQRGARDSARRSKSITIIRLGDSCVSHCRCSPPFVYLSLGAPPRGRRRRAPGFPAWATMATPRTPPCKTLAGAISRTAAGGEIDVLDPAGLGVVNITKSITIDGRGTLGSVLSASQYGIQIAAGANDGVLLRNMSINGIGVGTNGVKFISGKALHVEDCTITGFAMVGIDFEPTAAGSQLFVKGSTISQHAA